MSSIVREYFDEIKGSYIKIVKQECYQYDGEAKEIIPGYEYWTYARVSDNDKWELFEISEWHPRQQ